MAEDQQANVLSAAFPAPPPFYKHFTAENRADVERARQAAALRANTNGNSPSTSSPLVASELTALSSELRYLTPPDPPTTGVYRSFGNRFNINEALPSLRDQGVEQLFATPPASPFLAGNPDSTSVIFDRQFELTKLVRSILLSFLELVGTLSVNVEHYPSKLEDLRVLFVNAHHLINEYRPHQARETLIAMTEDQLNRKRAEVEGVRAMKEKVEAILSGMGHTGEEEEEAEHRGREAAQAKQRNDAATKHIWQALETIEL